MQMKGRDGRCPGAAVGFQGSPDQTSDMIGPSETNESRGGTPPRPRPPWAERSGTTVLRHGRVVARAAQPPDA
jgi:hypothetical protein